AMTLEFAITAFAAVFAVVNPIGNIPFFVAVTEGYSKDLRKRIIVKITVVIIVVLMAFALFGQYIFALYGITIPAFKIAGGILLFTISFSMVQGQRTRTKITEQDEEDLLAKEEIGIVPLGIPLFAGPGAITTVMIYISYATTSADLTAEVLEVFAAIFATAAISYLLLVYSTPIFDRMGRMGAAAFSRIMGLLLAAVAVEFIISGILQVAGSGTI
ncbi:MAG: MarC family protein, partial [Methanomassiliicoccales archaeon]|nr:MarC family protein [Methanomassiliicoccales archaeon]